MPEKTVEIEKKVASSPEIEEMMRAGLHFGHKSSKTHPEMRKFISSMRNTVHIIDLEKTREKLVELIDQMKAWREEGKTILFLGTKVQARDMVRETAESLDSPYVINRWIGGTLTNFKVISERIEYLNELERKLKEGELDQYTKKERLDLTNDKEKLEKKFGGIRNLTKIPDVLFIVDADENGLAIKEAKVAKVLVAGIADTNVDPALFDAFVPANDDAVSSLSYILSKIQGEMAKVKPEAPKTEEKEAEKTNGEH
ncbi:MAG: 30S ribosomal protein S2 [bacterium]|nr:30S ribosomal protein S2 [bacterium]MDZ4231630.1 30S ribosomal protein S2 [Candidatus Pacearchaeota archaeon]